MIEAVPDLATYGILGLWTASLLYEKFMHHSQTTQVMQELKVAIIKLTERISSK